MSIGHQSREARFSGLALLCYNREPEPRVKLQDMKVEHLCRDCDDPARKHSDQYRSDR